MVDVLSEVNFKCQLENKTTTNTKEYQTNIACNEELNVLVIVLQNKEVPKV